MARKQPPATWRQWGARKPGTASDCLHSLRPAAVRWTAWSAPRWRQWMRAWRRTAPASSCSPASTPRSARKSSAGARGEAAAVRGCWGSRGGSRGAVGSRLEGASRHRGAKLQCVRYVFLRACGAAACSPVLRLPRWRRRPCAPVMFLSGGGVYAHADPRRTSVAGEQGWQRQWDGAPHAGTNADLAKFVHAALEQGCRVPAPAPVLPANTPRSVLVPQLPLTLRRARACRASSSTPWRCRCGVDRLWASPLAAACGWAGQWGSRLCSSPQSQHFANACPFPLSAG